MEASQVNQLLEGHTTFAQEEKGLKIYHIRPCQEREDRKKGFRAFWIGEPSDQPSRCVLLLGETGAGKTTFINAAINHLFGVRFEDPFRLQLKEETEDDRMETESQTDLITAYTVYYREGMKHKYNFVLIDTPGLADTRGVQQQSNIRNCLEEFLTSDFAVDDLHCVGLVAKGNTNRDFDSQKTLLTEVISLLGDSVPEITHIFATFAVDEPTVDVVMKNAGVSFKNMFHFDNGVLFCSQTHNTMVPFRWNVMTTQYKTFIDALINAPSVSVKLLRERKLFDTCKKKLKVDVEKLATSIAAMETDKKTYMKYELQEAKNKEWMREETIEKKTTEDLEDGIHAHNCHTCQQTCVYPCYNSSGSNILAGVAGGVSGTAAGGLTSALTTNQIAAAAASTNGFTATIGNMAAQTLGGAISASEVGAAVGVAGASASLATGAAVGIALGLLSKNIYSKMTNSCGITGVDSVCGKDGCTHPLSQHVKEEKYIKTESKVMKKIDKNMKELYDVATSKKLDANVKIINGQQKILSYRRSVSHITVELMYHAKRVQELTSQHSDYVEDVTSQLINEIRLGEPNIIPYAVKHINILKKAMLKLMEYSANQVLGKHKLVEEMLVSVYRDH